MRGNDDGDEEADEAARFFALPIEGGQQAPFPVFPENRAAVDLFLWCESQWVRAGMNGAVVGLDTRAVIEIANVVNIPMTAKLLRQIKIMEAEAVRALAPRREGTHVEW